MEVETPFPPRLFNLCARENLLFWGLHWLDATRVQLYLPKNQVTAFGQLVQRQGGTLEELQWGGLPFFVKGFSHRIGFWVGLCLSLFSITILSHFVMVVEITGNDRVSTQEIRQALEQSGLNVGTFGGTLKLSQLTQTAMSQLEGIAWMSINVKGTHAYVDVRESVVAPDIPPTEGLYDLVAKVDGIVEVLSVHRGEALVQVGDTVTAGQVLVSGNVELPPPMYSLEPSGWMEVPSSGSVVARTWREITVVTPSLVKEKIPPSEDVVSVHSFQWVFFQKSGRLLAHSVLFPHGYQKEKESYYLPRLEEFPLSAYSYKETPFVLVEREVNGKLWQSSLEEKAMDYLLEQIGETGELVACDYQMFEKNGLLGVTLYGECLEEISLVVEGTYRQPLDYRAESEEESGEELQAESVEEVE